MQNKILEEISFLQTTPIGMLELNMHYKLRYLVRDNILYGVANPQEEVKISISRELDGRYAV